MDREVLKKVILDQHEIIKKFSIVPREIRLEKNTNYVLTGLRRAGKTVLLYGLVQKLVSEGTDWKQIIYINFEDERLEGFTLKDFDDIVSLQAQWGGKGHFFFDEIQNIDGWEKFARRLSDAKEHVCISGSNAKMLSSDILTTLGGRYINVSVYPYSFTEYLSANGVNISPTTLYATESRAAVLRHFDNYLHFGGFPEGACLKARRDYLTGVYQKIYLGDIAARHSVTNTFALRVLFKKLAESVKQPVSFSRLANIVSATGAKIGKSTVINYTEYARDAWLITPVTNIAGKLAEKESTPKYYFTDNGILNLFLLDGETSLLENLVAVTLLRKYGREDAVFFYRMNIEVDFYIPENSTAIQVCYSLSDKDTLERETKALAALHKVLPCKRLIVITRDEESNIMREGQHIEITPVWKWLLEESI